ncbi:MAG: hypothetical protein QM503_10755 [Bacteroidota bacterium]
MNITQTISTLIWVSIVFGLLASCDEHAKKDGENFTENLSSFNNTMDKLDSTLNLMDSMQIKIDKIEQDRNNGIITDEEAITKLNNLNNTLGRQIAHSSNINPVTGIPSWAKQLGLTAPANMVFDSDFSQSTSENNADEGFNSIILVYNGSYAEAIKQAGIIAQMANIPMSQDYKDALTLSQEYDIETIKGASYINFEFGSKNNPRYNISITVDDKGVLTINATDTQALMNQLNVE